MDGHASPGAGEAHVYRAGGAGGGSREKHLVGVWLVDNNVDLVEGVGAGGLGGSLEGDADAAGLGEGGVAESRLGHVAGGADQAAEVNLDLTADGGDCLGVELDEGVERSYEGANLFCPGLESETSGTEESGSHFAESGEAHPVVLHDACGTLCAALDRHVGAEVDAVDHAAVGEAEFAGEVSEQVTFKFCHFFKVFLVNN